MLYNYVKLAFRNLRRQAFFSGINIAGLAVGLAACWLLGLYVLYEHHYDRFLPASDRICAVALDLKTQQGEGRTTNTPPPLGPRLAADFPEIEMVARTFFLNESVVRREEPGQAPLKFNEEGVYAADTSFIELFGFPMLEGSAHTALDRPGSAVLSACAAQRYFGASSPVGRPILVNDRLFTVTGVAQTLPKNATVQFDFLLSMADFKVVERFSWSWIWLQMDTWVRLRDEPTAASLAALQAKFPDMVHRHAPAAFERIGQNFEAQIQGGDRYDVQLLPLQGMHLGQADLTSRLGTLGDGAQVRMFGLVGLLILLLACINFMNLSTARSALRAREVGVRKALGSQRGALVGQFLAESMLFSAIGMALAAGLAVVALPLFNRLTDLAFVWSDLFSGAHLLVAAVLTVATGLLGGLYPAFFLSRFKSADILKSTAGATTKGGHATLRGGLVVAQFAISIALLLGAGVVLRQLNFARTTSPGLERDNVLLLPILRNMVRYDNEEATLETFRAQIEALPEVVSVSSSQFMPSTGSFGDFYEPEQGAQSRAVVPNVALSSFTADTRFVPTLGLQIIGGRNFQDDAGKSDSTSVLLNEAAVKAIGWEQPLGQWLRYPGNRNQRFQVVGILRDFHTGSVRGPIEPVAVFHQSSKTYMVWSKYVAARLRPGTEQAAIAKIGALWSNVMPNAPFKYDFLDDSYGRMYRSEARMGTVLSVFTGLALLIACLGLFALSAFTAERRTKEIGIRKVLGASIGNVVGLLSKDFLLLVLLAALVAVPLAWYAMDAWLQDFVYRTPLSWTLFAGTIGLSLVIAFVTVGLRTWSAARANPVRSLRSE